jgi:hypothetical protein
MDIKTERGQQTLRDEQDAALIWERNFPAYQYVQTPKDQPALVDAMLVKDKVIMYCVETKCRYDMDLETFSTQRNNEWLVTYDKILNSRSVATGLGVPLIGFLYLVTDKILLARKITDDKGNFVCKMKTENTTTQRTVNGGQIVRNNAFIDMSDAKILLMPKGNI